MSGDAGRWAHNLPFPVLLPDWRGAPAHVRAMTTLRQGGSSCGAYGDAEGNSGLNLGDHVGDDLLAVKQNRDKLNRQLPSDVIFLSQVHGNIVVDAAMLRNQQHAAVSADAVFSSQTGLVCAVLTADCLPVLFTDVDGTVVAAAHAGWRGLANGVLQNTVRNMREAGAGEILAWLGPAIGPGEFEVGSDVLQAFMPQMGGQVDEPGLYFQPRAAVNGQDKYLADIYGLARKLLNDVGVTRISGGEHCTVRENQQFYSYRRDGISGRMASLIWIESAN
ncbi:peptidoglycan editing factor PgeF [Undibacterium sp. CY18W]|uniref:Purine nucleoside phosphorylase n=1 Tax=Undibacterium hunanense TaxID=2762292 RepID=A0ABR6ZK26_9BURK|nr:peptidoglycan editing factor PgeF [Undibacterium hunanense]MBC3916247.1 peptidoglycan editing factor PgeF [Undibacterium hunanense]